MIEEKIEDVRRTIGLGEKDPPRRSWLAPLALGVAAIGGVMALIASRLRGRATPKAKAASKPRTTARSRTNAGSTSGTRKTPTTRRTRTASTARRGSTKAKASTASPSE